MKFVKFEDIPEKWKKGKACLFRYEDGKKEPEHYIAYFCGTDKPETETGWFEHKEPLRHPIKLAELNLYDIYVTLIEPYDEADEL